jgi:hypothetical protein
MLMDINLNKFKIIKIYQLISNYKINFLKMNKITTKTNKIKISHLKRLHKLNKVNKIINNNNNKMLI